jgi:3-amino-5-hydroxybenzoic acid synthesis related protein
MDTMLKAIIFDLDGVLIDSEPLMRAAFETSYRRVIGAGTPPIEAYLEHMGEAFLRIMDKLGLPRAMWEPYFQYCQEHIDQITLFPHCREILAWASEQGLALALFTGKDHIRTLQILEHFGLRHYFRAVVSSDQLQKPKPDPEGILYTLHLLCSSITETVMIGDAVNDILCAQAAGVRSIAVTWGIKPERVQALSTPDFIVHNGHMLLEVLQNLKQGKDRRAVPHFLKEESHGSA